MKEEYLEGNVNLLKRAYFYLSNGLAVVNEFRNLLLGIFGIYITLKLENPFIMVILFVVSLLILIPTGYVRVHHVSKVMEWLNIKYGSHYAIQNFDYMKAQYELLKEINEKLGKK
jgi:hypothetical protein